MTTARSSYRIRRNRGRYLLRRPEVLEDRHMLAGAFSESVAISGLTNPTVVRFASDGRVFVAEKSGLIKVFDDMADDTPDTFADLRTNVHNFWDRGLLGMDLHPNFPATPYVYVLYAHDAEIGGTAPVWGSVGGTSDPCPNPPGATGDGCVVSGRLSRLEASGNMMVGSEQVLIEDWGQQYPSHSTGAIEFGPDGALYASGGDGASFNFVDYGQDGTPVNPLGDPPVPVGGTQSPPTAEGGALRSQDLRTAGDPVSLDGTIIRVDDLGAPLPDNPMIGDADINAQRTIAYGLRNPFRFGFRPGTNELWSGDVGWGTFEEVNLTDVGDQVVDNFGWPCYEGVGHQPGYDGADLDICENLYNDLGAHTEPFFAYDHADQVDPGSGEPTGSSSIAGIAFYDGGSYPDTYDGALFFADYSRDRIWVMFPGADGLPDPSTAQTFIGPAANPVNLAIGPAGDLFYPDFNGGTIRRVEYFTDNTPPTALAQATPLIGASPLTVDFDASGSSDPDVGDVLTYAWDFDADGDFDDSTLVTPSFTYTATGTYEVSLKVTDSEGFSDIDMVTISVDSGPPVAVIDTPVTGTTWQVDDLISFSGHATDPDDGPLPASALSWTIILHHCPSNCHTHTVQTFDGVSSGSFFAPDHEYYSYLELILTATDSDGLETTESLLLEADTSDITLESNAPGIELVLNAASSTAPSTNTVIVGSNNSISAATPQNVGGVNYEFVSWSDGGARSHNVIVGDSDVSYTATFLTDAYQQDSGANNIVSIESTAFDANTANGSHDWVSIGDANATLGQAMQTTPNSGTNNNTGYVANSPRLDFDVNFVTTGTHYVWIRGMAPPTSGSNDSIHIGLNGAEVATADRISGFGTGYGWSNNTMDSVVATIDVATPGIHTVNAWMREDGFIFDKLLLTTSSAYTPGGDGPAQSPRLNRAPISVDDSFGTSMDLTLDVAAPGALGNDYDPDPADSMTVDSVVSDVQHGSLTLNADGSFQYVPNGGFQGVDSFTYRATDGTDSGNVATVTITVGSIIEAHFNAGSDGFNYVDDPFRGTNAPTYASGTFLTNGGLTGGGLQVLVGGINNDDILGISGGWQRTFNLTAPTNVTVSLQYNMTQTGPHETDELSQALLSIDGVLYGTTPNDYLAQIVGDGNSGPDLTTGWQPFTVNVGALGVGTHTITIGGYNNKKTYNDESTVVLIDDVVVTGSALNNPPVAEDDVYGVNEDQSLVIDASTGVLQNDTDADAEAISVLGVVDDVDDGTLSLNADGSFVYTPDPDFSGTDTFTYEATDGTSASNVATVTITVAPVNDPPVALDDNYNTAVQQQLTVSAAAGVLANDTDVDGDTLSVASLVSDVSNGTLILNADGSFDYTPDAAFEGVDSFTYEALDGAVISNVATVTIAVSTFNTAPVAFDDAYTIDQDLVLNVNAVTGVLANDTDADGNPLTAVEVTSPTNGNLSLNADGSFQYTPSAGFSGTDTFAYAADDGIELSNTAVVTIRVVGPTLRTGEVTNATTDGWVTVNLDHDYASMVVVATPSYNSSSVPLVTRIQNAAGSSFQVKLDRADGQSGSVSGIVHYLVAEAGVYNAAQHGATMEVVRFNSSLTDYKTSWAGTSRSYINSYTNPVVLGQVMTHNDDDFSVFWARGSSATNPPSSTDLFVGKQVAEDSDTTRAAEEIGYIVIEAGNGSLGGRAYTAQLGEDTIRGMGNSPPFSYTLTGLTAASTAVASQAGMDGNNGGWPVLYGANPVSASQLDLAVDEDQIGDNERNHITEQIAYLVLQENQGSKKLEEPQSSDGDDNPAIEIDPRLGDFNGDDVVDADDLNLIGPGIRAQGDRFDVDANGAVERADFEFFASYVYPVVVGDSNLDGEFDSGDLLQVFQIGEYEDDVDGNSGWHAGDWNGDGDFDSRDIILAFQADTFDRGVVFEVPIGARAADIASALTADATAAVMLRNSMTPGVTKEMQFDLPLRSTHLEHTAHETLFSQDEFVTELRLASMTEASALEVDDLQSKCRADWC